MAKERNWNGFTTAEVVPGNIAGVPPEFGRWQDVRRIFGIKRGQLYLLTNEGKVRSVSLRRPGCKHGSRLWHLASISSFLNAKLHEQSIDA
jgi:hypothetical protein